MCFTEQHCHGNQPRDTQNTERNKVVLFLVQLIELLLATLQIRFQPGNRRLQVDDNALQGYIIINNGIIGIFRTIFNFIDLTHYLGNFLLALANEHGQFAGG
ncbi:hypothetical protein D3C73_866100 [compost metagenome]